MIRAKKAELRHVARQVLEQEGYRVDVRTGQGILPGARLVISKKGKSWDVSVRTGNERLLSFTRRAEQDWRTLSSVDYVVAVLPATKDSQSLEVFFFDATTLVQKFNQALEALKRSNRSPSLDMPVFVPVDPGSRKNLGHRVAGLKAIWSRKVSPEYLGTKVRRETFIERVRREFAEIVGADPDKVVVEFRVVD
jgi:hypothetical protein